MPKSSKGRTYKKYSLEFKKQLADAVLYNGVLETDAASDFHIRVSRIDEIIKQIIVYGDNYLNGDEHRGHGNILLGRRTKKQIAYETSLWKMRTHNYQAAVLQRQAERIQLGLASDEELDKMLQELKVDKL